MTARIVTVTLNPAIDLAVGLQTLVPGEVHRARTAATMAGGKGVNVAACLADWGLKPTAAGLLGADNADAFEALFAAKGIADAMTRMAGATRINVKVSDTGGRTTDINLPGLPAAAEDLKQVRKVLERLDPTILVLAGSLPDGLPASAWADLSADWKARGAQVVMDISGEPLSIALARPRARPHLVKPNRDELSDLAGGTPLDDEGLLRQARLIQAAGVDLIAVSLGAQGALFVGGGEAVHAASLPVDVPSSVGAGDAMVSGLIAALCEGADLERKARLATAFAAGKLRVLGPYLPPRQDIEALAAQVRLTCADDWIGQGQGAA